MRHAGSGARADEPYPPLIQPLTVEQVPGAPIYYTVGSPGIPEQKNEGHTSNAGFVVTADGVVVFDALGTPSLGWNLLKPSKRSPTGRYATMSSAIITPITFTACRRSRITAPSIIVAQERATEYREDEETAGERADQRLDQRREALSPWVDANTRVVPPDITFDSG